MHSLTSGDERGGSAAAATPGVNQGNASIGAGPFTGLRPSQRQKTGAGVLSSSVVHWGFFVGIEAGQHCPSEARFIGTSFAGGKEPQDFDLAARGGNREDVAHSRRGDSRFRGLTAPSPFRGLTARSPASVMSGIPMRRDRSSPSLHAGEDTRVDSSAWSRNWVSRGRDRLNLAELMTRRFTSGGHLADAAPLKSGADIRNAWSGGAPPRKASTSLFGVVLTTLWESSHSHRPDSYPNPTAPALMPPVEQARYNG